ncbi:MAG: PHP domain-containing protein [Candidatus Bathyarchaeota archaeon]|nr:PHP domain-containing protein [Candidatus Bathyarchaeota archaeon]MDH5787025.1 PHP domain-containing protein [Candidatus Bathyarchaeota archaeon]
MSELPLIRADLHVHTKYSSDASIQPKTIADQLYAHSSIKAVAITDHNTVEGYHKVRKLASAYEDILIIPGVEISTNEGDVVILGTAELPPKPWTVKTVVNFAKERNNLTIVAHPYRAYGLGDKAKNYDFDAIEVLNGVSTSHINRMAEDLAREMGLPGVAGGDAHVAEELWTVYTEIQASADIDEIFSAIRKGQIRVAQTEKSIHF